MFPLDPASTRLLPTTAVSFDRVKEIVMGLPDVKLVLGEGIKSKEVEQVFVREARTNAHVLTVQRLEGGGAGFYVFLTGYSLLSRLGDALGCGLVSEFDRKPFSELWAQQCKGDGRPDFDMY